jgi:hypothetical protein
MPKILLRLFPDSKSRQDSNVKSDSWLFGPVSEDFGFLVSASRVPSFRGAAVVPDLSAVPAISRSVVAACVAASF